MRGADPRAASAAGMTALMLACQRAHVSTARALLEGVDDSTDLLADANQAGDTALSLASYGGHAARGKKPERQPSRGEATGQQSCRQGP